MVNPEEDRAIELQQSAEAAEDCEFLVSDPPPRVWFTGFGDNALNFRLQGYIADIDHMLMSKSALHFLINRKFADAGISIAFPQRDVHLDTSGPILLRIPLPSNRSTRLSSSGSIHKMMISRGRR